jgi:hypothetical protein
MMVKIRMFTGDDPEPDKTITISIPVLKIAPKLLQSQVPVSLDEFLDELGIDIGKIVEWSEESGISGPLVEIEEHQKNRKLIVAIE